MPNKDGTPTWPEYRDMAIALAPQPGEQSFARFLKRIDLVNTGERQPAFVVDQYLKRWARADTTPGEIVELAVMAKRAGVYPLVDEFLKIAYGMAFGLKADEPATPEGSRYRISRTFKEDCPVCGNHAMRMLATEQVDDAPAFYICPTCLHVFEIGVGPVPEIEPIRRVE